MNNNQNSPNASARRGLTTLNRYAGALVDPFDAVVEAMTDILRAHCSDDSREAQQMLDAVRARFEEAAQ